MAISVTVQYNDGFPPDILLLTQASIFVWFDGTSIVPWYIITTLSTMYYIVFSFGYVWWLCMAINVSDSIKVDFSPTLYC